jgi:hypothetical protein
MCDTIFSGVFERHPRLTLAIVELSWAPHLLSTMNYALPRAPQRGTLPVQGPLGPLRQPYTGNGETPTIGACPPSISR